MAYRLRKVLLFTLLWIIMTTLWCERALASPIAPNPPLPPGAHWEVATGGNLSNWQTYLTGSDISGIVVDDNLLWASSNGGLLRWDRATGVVTQYLAPAFPLPSNSLSQLLLHEGQLYISGKGGVVIFDRQDHWISYDEMDIGMPVGYHAPLALIDDVLWVAGEEGLAFLHPDGHWEQTRYGQAGLPEHRIKKIVEREGDAYIVIALGPTVDDERRVLRQTDGIWEEIADPTIQYFETPDGTLWKGIRSELFKSTDQGQSWNQVLASDFVSPETTDGAGRLYLSSDDTILVLEDEKIIERYSFTDVGPELNHINIIQWDAAGRMWIATDGRGLTMFDGEHWHNWQDGDAGMRDDCIRGMALGNGWLYAGTHSSGGTGGVNILDIETLTWTNFWPGESELSGGGVDGIAVDEDDRVYFPTSAGVLDVFDHGTWEHIPIPNLPDGHIFGFSEAVLDSQGDYWVGINGFGLHRYDGRNWTRYDTPGRVNALEVDAEGRLWVATTHGLVVRGADDKRWFYYGEDALPTQEVWLEDIAVDSAGRAWIILNAGLLVFNGQEWHFFSPDEVGASVGGDALDIDQQGNVWIAAGWGLAEYRGETELAPFAELQNASHVLSDSQVAHRKVAPLKSGPLVGLTVLFSGGMCLVLLLVAGGVGFYFLLRNREERET